MRCRDQLLLDLVRPKKAKSKKKLSLLQAYSKKYFQVKYKAITESHYTEHLQEVEAGLAVKLKPLDHRNRVLKEFWEEESEDVKKQIDLYWEHLFKHGSSSGEEDGGGEDSDEENSDGEDKWKEDEAQDEGIAASARDKGKAKKKAPDPAEARAKEYHE